MSIASLGLLGSGPLCADTLEDALSAAYAGNPTLQGNRDLTAAADEGVVQAKSAFGPTLSASARHTFTTSRLRGTVFPSESEGFGTTAELSLTQPLFTFGRLGAAVDAAEATKLVVRANLEATTQSLIADVVAAYVGLQRDIELYGVSLENYELLRQQRDVTASRYRLRDSTQPDVDQTTNRLELAAGRLVVARATVESSAARYRALTGVYPGALAPLPQLPALPTLETLYVEADRNNPTLASARFTELRSRALVAAARAQMRPEVTGFGALSRSPLSPYQNTARQEAAIAGVSVTMPLYTGGQMSSALRENIDRNLADQQFVEEARRTVRQDLASDWAVLLATTSALPRYDAAVLAAESAVAGVKKQEQSGIRTLRDVLDVTNDLLNARVAAAEARAENYLRKVAVLRDAGLLEIGLFSKTQPYDPDSRRSGLASLAGLPLRPILEPIDKLFVSDGVKSAPVQEENALMYSAPPLSPDLAAPPTSTGEGGEGAADTGR